MLSCRLASGLLTLGVRPGDRIAIALGSSPELFTACWGVTIAGAALVVLGDALSAELRGKIAHCEPTVVICEEPHARELALVAPGAQVIAVRAQHAPAQGMPRTALFLDDLLLAHTPLDDFVKVPAGTLFQLCYTSGSTGRPKAVPYTHEGVDRFLRSFAERLPERHVAATAVVCAPPTAFGARLVTLRVVANSRFVIQAPFVPEETLAAIERFEARQISLLPTMAEQLIAANAKRDFNCKSLRAINIGGAHVPASLLEGLRRLVSPGPVRIVVQYGMTETGGGIAETTEGGDGVVGRVLPGNVVRIHREDGSEAGVSEIGEIIARTAFSPREYWRDPEQTRQVFKKGFVHTGDLGFFREDGQLCLVGRSKDVIVQGGVKVYPAELVEVIARVAGVRECAVVGCANEVLGEEVVACVAGSHVGEAAIWTECSRALDPKKQPVRIVFLDELPKRDGGKIDMEAVRRAASVKADVAGGRFGTSQSLSKVRELIEHEVGVILSGEDGGIERRVPLDPNIPLHELGLTSLGAARLVHALQNRFAVQLASGFAYANPTINACAQALIARSPVDTAVPGAIAHADPTVAVVGLGLRLPGGVTRPAAFWDLLWTGQETVGDPPAERRRGRDSQWRAAFLENAGDFDAAFFRLTASASEMDPRHRQLLEVCWEAFEDAGIDPTAAGGERTALFLGLSGERYPSQDPLGTTIGMAAGHICHFFDIGGPVVTIDTTCSSSLVALHHALQSLRRGECDLAVVGGANLLHEGRVEDRLGIMSGDGRTRAFDAAADGFGQGEGTLVMILRSLETAVVAGDRIYACLLGSAINHDGRSSSLTAPNPASQARVISSALRSAGVVPDAVQYVEAHGTGTLLGDPIEVNGIVRSLCAARHRPIMIGSVKSNIGHLEAAAGIAGVAKVALAIAHRRLPASRLCHVPNPRIPWADIQVRVQTARGEWPYPDRALIAGVSAFGMSGTNAHVVLSEAPRHARDELRPTGAGADGPWLLPISAQSENALHAAALRWVEALEGCGISADCRDIAYSASCRRAHSAFRIAVSGTSADDWAARIRRLIASGKTLSGRVSHVPRKLCVVFSGQGSQWSGMALELALQEPVFARMLDRCAGLVEVHTGWNPVTELKRGAQSRIDSTEVTQPVLFAVQVSLWELWRQWGLEPTAVLGHSAGEIAAAYAAGMLSLEEAIYVVCERGRLCAQSEAGLMVAAFITEREAESICMELPDGIQIAAVNSPNSVTLSGSEQAIRAALPILAGRQVRVQVLKSGHAFHSHLMRGAAAAIRSRVPDPPARPSHLKVVSGMTAKTLEYVGRDYWSKQLLEPVRFAQAFETLRREGYSAFLEISPHPVLVPAMCDCLGAYGDDAIVVGSLRRGRGDAGQLLESLGGLYCANVPIDWSRRFEPKGRHVDLPTYPWEHRRYWHGSTLADEDAATACGPPVALYGTPHSHRACPEPPLQSLIGDLADVRLSSLTEDLSLQELGIDSLGLIQIGSRLARLTRRPYSAPRPESTLGELARRLTTDVDSGGRTNHVPGSFWLRSTGEKPLHVWVHPAGGGIDCYRGIAEALPYTSLALDFPGLHADCQPADSIEGLAAEYLAVVARECPDDRLVIAGWSFGGIVALEMAIQLARSKKGMPKVVLIDSFLGNGLRNLETNVDLPAVASRHAMDTPGPKRLRDIRLGHMEALLRYRPTTYPGPVLSLRAVPSIGDPDAQLKAVAANLAIHQVPADHFSIMDRGPMDRLRRILAGVGDEVC